MVERVVLARKAVYRSLLGCVVLVGIGIAGVQEAYARQVDLTVFVGRSFPVADDRLMMRVSAPSLPGLDVEVSGDPAIRVDGGLVVGAALAFELGIVGIEGVDATDVGFDVIGARYDLRATPPSFAGLAGSVEIGDGRLDAKRLYLVSGNLRLRTPGPSASSSPAASACCPMSALPGRFLWPPGSLACRFQVWSQGCGCASRQASRSTASAPTLALACGWAAIAWR